VAPVALTPAAAPTDQAAPPPPAPITTSVPVDTTPSTPPVQAAVNPSSRLATQNSSLAQLIQQIQERRHPRGPRP